LEVKNPKSKKSSHLNCVSVLPDEHYTVKVCIDVDTARLVLGLHRRSSITTALRDLHWLPVKHRITSKVATLMHQALHRRCPAYLADLVAYLRANFSLPSPLVFNLGPMYATDRQMSNAHHRWMPLP